MNRPFSAFATLMTLLALAMFAVSSSSRSTTIRPAARGQRPALEVSDLKAKIGGRKSETGKKRFVPKARDRAVIAAANGTTLKPLAKRNQEQRAVIMPARVEAAENSPANVRIAPVMDYRSHYDPGYDLLVYGIRDNTARTSAVETETDTSSANLSGELDAIFHELAVRGAGQPLPQAGAMYMEGIGLRWKALAAAAGAWLKYQASRPLELKPAPGVGWAEYAEFADSVAAANVASIEVAEISDAKKSVRSGDWLRHSAALGLHQLSLLLEAAAGEVEGVGRPALSAIGN